MLQPLPRKGSICLQKRTSNIVGVCVVSWSCQSREPHTLSAGHDCRLHSPLSQLLGGEGHPCLAVFLQKLRDVNKPILCAPRQDRAGEEGRKVIFR